MNLGIVRYFEFFIPFTSIILSFVSLLILAFFNLLKPISINMLYGQIGLCILGIGILIRFKAFNTKAYYGTIKITGIYAIVRQPIFLSTWIIFLGLNIIVFNLYYLCFSVAILFILNFNATKKYEKILKRKYKDIYQIYENSTYLFLPFPIRIRDVFKNKVYGTAKFLDDYNTILIFGLLYAILVFLSVVLKLNS